jgi:mitochondrial chaperone BCS1
MVLEDIDTAFSGRQPSSEKGYGTMQLHSTFSFQSSITLSGFLNALDGVVASEERIVFMTTNHPEKLDPALIRPGRVDVKEYLGYASRYQIQEMFTRFYGGSEDRAICFAKAIGDDHNLLSTADLQGIFISNKENPEGALEDANRYVQKRKIELE